MAWDKATLRLTFKIDTDDEGNPITKSKSYSNLREGASAENCIAVAQELEGLQIHSLIGLTKIDYDKMMEL